MKKYLYLIYPLISLVLCSFLLLSPLDKKIADIFQRALPALSESDDVAMINVNDVSIANIGVWPFSRDVYADMLNELKDLDVQSVVFDLSFLDKSPAKVDERYVTEELPSYIDYGFERINDDLSAVMDGYSTSDYGAADAYDVLDALLETTETVKEQLQVNVNYVMRPVDEIFAKAIEYSDCTYLTLTFENTYNSSEEEQQYLMDKLVVKNVTAINDTKTPEYENFEPCIMELLSHGNGAGFVNAEPDDDGFTRRVYLFYKYKGEYYPQLVMKPLLDMFGNPDVEITNSYVLLKNAKYPDGTVKNVKIPRDEKGCLVLKYPKFKEYADYNCVPLWNIYRLSILDKQIYENMKTLNDNGFFGYWDGDNPVELYDTALFIKNEILNSGEDPEAEITYENYRLYKKAAFENLDAFLSGETRNYMIESVEGDQETIDWINDEMNINLELFTKYKESQTEIYSKMENCFTIVGTNAASTTDFGLMQYQERYPNPGVHYTVANQILSCDFVDDSPFWISLILAVIICYVFALVSHRVKSTGKQIFVGVTFIIVLAGLLFLFFVITKTYVGSVVPVTSLTLTFIVTSVAGFLTASHQKRFIQSAFSQCLSPDVVKEIVDNPSSFKLGGQTIDMTAIFTDIQKFSGFSELLSAGQLVALLNFYLTKMSDIIMEQRGTVDKYEGDAIVAFVGAPVKTSEHAALACRAAINMKKAEIEMNDYIRQVAAGPKPEDMDDETYEAFCIMVKNNRTIFTRIGLNSGEIVAGYMGSTNKKNYTMMGNNVNLASRLEGVNKQYRTGGILMSAATRAGLKEDFIVRSLDRVQVVNVVTPIRLYELLGIKDESNEKLVKYVEAWEQTMKIFESGDYAKALELFKKLSAAKPDDNVAKYYIELIEKFFINGKFPTENDDFGVAYNPENPEGMNEMWINTPYEIKGTFKLLQK